MSVVVLLLLSGAPRAVGRENPRETQCELRAGETVKLALCIPAMKLVEELWSALKTPCLTCI